MNCLGWSLLVLLIVSLQALTLVRCEIQSQQAEFLEQIENSAQKEQDQLDADDDEVADQSQRSREEAKKCVPMLDLPSYLNSNNSNASNRSQRSSFSSANVSLSFQIKDIEMPLQNQNGDSTIPGSSAAAANSALKLLSTFSSPLDAFGVDTEEDQPQNKLSIKFSENQLHLRGLNLSMLNVHLHENDSIDSKFSIGVIIKNTTLLGKFSYNGPTSILSTGESKLEAYYRLSIDNIMLIASSNLTKQEGSINISRRTERDERIATGSRFSLVANDFKLNITNLGYINIDIFDHKNSMLKPTSNYILRILQRFLQKTIKRTYFTFENYIREVLERESKRALDCELTRFAPLLDDDGQHLAGSSPSSQQLISATGASQQGGRDYRQSALAKIISNEIERSQLNSVNLPDFDYQQTILGSSAKVVFFNGSLSGLSNIRLNGETKIKLQDDKHLYVNTSIGWFNLKPYYSWNLLLGSSATNSSNGGGGNSTKPALASGFVSFHIKEIDFDASIVKGLIGKQQQQSVNNNLEPTQNRIIVDHLIIKKLDSIKMDLSGLPGMNRVTRGMVNFFMSRLKQRLASSIQPALKLQLEKSLNRMSVFA